MEEKILYNVLREVNYSNSTSSTSDPEYIQALETIRLIKNDWGYKLTEFGHSMFSILKNKFEKW